MTPFALPAVEAMLVSVSPGERRAAIMRDGRPWELLVDRDTRPSLVGSIHRARVRRIERGVDAAFLEIADGVTAFLPLSDRRASRLSEGDSLLVQVTRDAVDDKGPTVSTRIAQPGRYLVYAPTRPGVAAGKRLGKAEPARRLQDLLLAHLRPEEGVILRSAAVDADPATVLRELDMMRGLWTAIGQAAGAGPPRLLHSDLPPLMRLLRDRPRPPRIIVDDGFTFAAIQHYAAANAPELSASLSRWREPQPLFEIHGVEDEIEAALGGTAALPSGGMLHIGSTRALIAIDVDSAKHAGRGRGADTLLEVDLEAAVEAARLIRCRNLSGLIVIDFASLTGRSRREAVDARLRAALADDAAELRVVPMSELGLVEIARQRLGPSLPELLGGMCPTCMGQGRVVAGDAVATAGLRAVLRAAAAANGRPTLVASPGVVEQLETPLDGARRATEERLGQELVLRAEPPAAPHWMRAEMVP